MMVKSHYIVRDAFRASIPGTRCSVMVGPRVTFNAKRRRAADLVVNRLLSDRLRNGSLLSVKYKASVLTVLTHVHNTTPYATVSVSR